MYCATCGRALEPLEGGGMACVNEACVERGIRQDDLSTAQTIRRSYASLAAEAEADEKDK